MASPGNKTFPKMGKDGHGDWIRGDVTEDASGTHWETQRGLPELEPRPYEDPRAFRRRGGRRIPRSAGPSRPRTSIVIDLASARRMEAAMDERNHGRAYEDFNRASKSAIRILDDRD